MEEDNSKEELHGKAVRQLAVRTSGSLKSTLSGRYSPRNSPPSRRLHSNRTRRELRTSSGELHCFRSNRIVLWLMLITIWAYIGFHVQSKWAHGEHRKEELIGYKSKAASSDKLKKTKTAENLTTSSENHLEHGEKNITSIELRSTLFKKGSEFPSNNTTTNKKRNRRSDRRLRRTAVKQKDISVESRTGEIEEGMIPRRNTSYGLIVGPFGKTEDGILGWSAEKRRGTCDRKGEFARLVWSRSFVLVFHELSMTGAPLSMMELASELLSCGASVSAVVLSMKGGLITELEKRGIRVLKDKARISFKTAMKVDLIIAGSAVCSSWIEQYLAHFPAGSTQIVWWIMENRREYFNRSKDMLDRVKLLIFLSGSQSKQWLSWCEEDQIHLNIPPMIVPLSVNDELAFVAGIPCSLNTPAFSVQSMVEKRNMLRSAVRKEMGLDDNDMLVLSLSSINPTKGQRLFLESALLVAEHNVSLKLFGNNDSFVEKFKGQRLYLESALLVAEHNVSLKLFGNNDSFVEKLPNVSEQNQSIVNIQLNSGSISRTTNEDHVHKSNTSNMTSKKRKSKHSKLTNIASLTNHTSKIMNGGDGQKLRNLLSESKDQVEQRLKVLIGSLGSKSNKVLYIKSIVRFLSQHSILSKIVLWTPTTTQIASLYAAADVYVINAQGLGETFGRVTIEAMAFGLPVLGTDAGGTQEIVDHRVTGLLHPVGSQGVEVLAQNMQYLLNNPTVRNKMGMLGRTKVQEKYLKKHTYENFAKVLIKCMKIK